MISFKGFISILSILLFIVSPAIASQNIESKKIQDGSSWNIGGGDYIRMEDVNYEGYLALMTKRKDGDVLKDAIIQSGEKFEYIDTSDTFST